MLKLWEFFALFCDPTPTIQKHGYEIIFFRGRLFFFVKSHILEKMPQAIELTKVIEMPNKNQPAILT